MARVFTVAGRPPLSDEKREEIKQKWSITTAIIGEKTFKSQFFKQVVSSTTTSGKQVIIKAGAVGTSELNILSILRHAGCSFVPAPLGFYFVENLYRASVMELMPGVPVTRTRYTLLPPWAKKNFRRQLAEKLIQIRQSTSNWIECPYGFPPPQQYQCTRLNGRFNSENDYNQMRLEILAQLGGPDSKASGEKLLEEHYKLHPISTESRFVMTHRDLFPGNILMENSLRGNVTAIVDFGLSGYYLDYMEYAMVMNGTKGGWWEDVMIQVMEIVCPEYTWDDPILQFEQLMNQVTDP